MVSDFIAEDAATGIGTVGIVGVGRTGSWFVTKLNRAEYETVIFDVDTDDYQQVRPVIDTLGYEHEFFEGIGNGHVVKAAVALRGICRAVIAAEVSEFLENNGISPDRVIDLLDWEVPESYADPPYLTNRGFEQAVHGDAETPDRRGFDVDDSGARTRLDTTDWAKDPAYALAVARASNSYVPLLTAAHQTALLAENYGRALTDRELAFDDEEWHLFHLRSLYRSLSRPQEEWRRLDQWE